MSSSFSAIIPAAGNSGRMGCDKALLSLGPALTFAGHLVNCFGNYGCNPVILVVNERFDPSPFHYKNLVTVVNNQLEKGRSWSIFLGLKQVPGGSACFIQNVDNPFLEPDLLDRLASSLTPDSYSVPVYRGHGGHPVLLGNNVADILRNMKDLVDFRLVLQQFPRVEVPFPDERILWNINTPGDYKEFMQWHRASDKNL